MIRPREKKLTANRLFELLSYNSATGIFRWQETRGKAKAGDRAGSRTRRGGRVISIDAVKYDSLRLAYLAENGDWPPDGHTVIPADGDPDNARFINLKLVPEVDPEELQKTELTPALIRKLFELRDGKLHWAVDGHSSRIRYGAPAGTAIAPHPGYADADAPPALRSVERLRRVGIGKKKSIMASHLIFALIHDELPTGCEVVRQQDAMVKRKLRERLRNETTGRFCLNDTRQGKNAA